MVSIDSTYTPLYLYTETTTRPKNQTRILSGKRIFDISFSLLVIILMLTWLMPLIGLLIIVTSKGPILFRQKRTGYRGSWFYCLKFRTMTHNPSAAFQQATRHDERVTPLGRFLRRTNLDELPQFFNVLMGQMSVVGPRPHALDHSAQYWNSMPEYRKRYRVKPGITGLAQVRGCRGETEQLMKMRHRVKYDRFYNRRKSLLLDLWIIWLTVKSMIEGNMNVW